MKTLRRVVVATALMMLPMAPAVPAATQGDLSTAPRITVQEAQKAVDAGRALMIDVRDDSSYEAGHIAGATLIPLDKVVGRAAEWKKTGKTIILYCA